MAFQKKVEINAAAGVPGMLATPDQAVYNVVNLIAEEDIQCGMFAFPSSSDAEHLAAAKGEGAPVGVVVRLIDYVNYDLLSDGSITLPKGSTLTVATLGDVFMQCDSAATVGQHVFVSTSDGKISVANAGSGSGTDTGWVVKTAAAANEPFIASNWGTAAMASAGGSSPAAAKVDLTSGVTGVLPKANGGTGSATGVDLTSVVTGVLPKANGGTGSASGINLASDVTGILAVTNGGTGASDASGAKTNLKIQE